MSGRIHLCGLLVVLAPASTPSNAIPLACWDTDATGCTFMADYDPRANVTHWNYSCPDGGFYYGSMSGNQMCMCTGC